MYMSATERKVCAQFCLAVFLPEFLVCPNWFRREYISPSEIRMSGKEPLVNSWNSYQRGITIEHFKMMVTSSHVRRYSVLENCQNWTMWVFSDICADLSARGVAVIDDMKMRPFRSKVYSRVTASYTEILIIFSNPLALSWSYLSPINLVNSWNSIGALQ